MNRSKRRRTFNRDRLMHTSINFDHCSTSFRLFFSLGVVHARAPRRTSGRAHACPPVSRAQAACLRCGRRRRTRALRPGMLIHRCLCSSTSIEGGARVSAHVGHSIDARGKSLQAPHIPPLCLLRPLPPFPLLPTHLKSNNRRYLGPAPCPRALSIDPWRRFTHTNSLTHLRPTSRQGQSSSSSRGKQGRLRGLNRLGELLIEREQRTTMLGCRSSISLACSRVRTQTRHGPLDRMYM